MTRAIREQTLFYACCPCPQEIGALSTRHTDEMERLKLVHSNELAKQQVRLMSVWCSLPTSPWVIWGHTSSVVLGLLQEGGGKLSVCIFVP